jgi:two-component system LytT family sensor kinase
VVRAALAGDDDHSSMGLSNVDARLRQVYGDGYGLVVETAPDAGTKVTFRVPKYSSGVRAQSTLWGDDSQNRARSADQS